MLKDREELKGFYERLDGKYEGYIQLSGDRLKHVYFDPTPLPEWDSLVAGGNFILEMALYAPDTRVSILVKQHNDRWHVTERTIEESATFERYIIYPNAHYTMRVAQVWEPRKSTFCLDMEVLEPALLLFAGFESGGHDDHRTV